MSMDNNRLAMINPRVLHLDNRDEDSQTELARGINERFMTFYTGMRDAGAVDYDLDRIASAIFYLRTLLTRKGLTGKDKTAVEIGCGAGAKSLSLCGLFGTYIGIEINHDQVKQAEERNRLYGTPDTRFIAGNAADVLRDKKKYEIPDRIDVLVLYAVLEHLTNDERRTVIGLADEVMDGGGSVLVMETPNRLIPYDSHTTGIQFYNWLPDEIANNLAKTGAANTEVRSMLRPWDDPAAQTMLARAGRGVSYHDFVLNLRFPLDSYSFDVDGFDAELMNMEPFTNQDFSLYGYLSANAAEINAAAFSRSWLDFVISRKSAPQKRCKYFSPFWPKWALFDDPPSFWHLPAVILARGRATWQCEMPTAYVQDVTLIFNAPNEDGKLTLKINDENLTDIEIDVLVRSKPHTWHRSHSVSIRIGCDVTRIAVEADVSRGPILFQGCMISA
ncbi:class I SAM-dependent methyltransferase [Pseudomonas sp. LB3P38]|uniref:class I SAM-dependent methyltransferase n=1 Tax=Pseudomonas lyxosi TaxID=3398358 RepID=UPI0039EF2285